MLTIMNDLPGNVVGFRATGHVNKEDYTVVMIPAVDELVKRQKEINFMLVLDTALKNFTLGAFLKDIGVGLKHFTKWHKMAIVSESLPVNRFTDAFSYISPGETRGFTHAEMDEAKKWVSED